MSLQVVADGYTFLEGPRWHQGRLWVSDFYTHQVLAISPADGRAEVMARVPQQPSGTGFLPDGRALIVSMRDRKVLRRESSGELVVHADLMKLAPFHCNDMMVDAKGRAYVGNFGWDLMGGAPPASTCLIRVDPDGSARVAAEGLMFPNGTVLTPDGRTLIVAESFGGKLTAFDVAADGSLSNQRVWARLGDVPTEFHGDIPDTVALPDGICLDAEGAVWYADGIRQCVVRVAEGGRELERISTAPFGVYACMLGGDDGRTLFMCAAPDFYEEERKAKREGRILAARVTVPHAGLP